MEDGQVYEVFREKHRIVERRDGCVWKTELVEKGWFPDTQVLQPEQDIMYVHCSMTDPEAPLLRIRRA